jgi:hypothetical protein
MTENAKRLLFGMHAPQKPKQDERAKWRKREETKAAVDDRWEMVSDR